MHKNVAIIGQGYVGLPLAIAAAKSAYNVIGIDIDPFKVELLNKGLSFIEDIASSEIIDLISKHRYKASTNYADLTNSDIFVICVPTPLDENRKPDLSYIKNSVKSLAKYLSKGSVVILESTVETGTTRNFLIPLLENESGLKRNDFHVVFSPERIDPSNRTWGIKNTPKLVAGVTLEATQLAVSFYKKFIETVIECDSLEIAETSKLLENSFRLINISFINEISILCHKLGLDVIKVIQAAASKPYGFMAFYPSIGIGGHCIPVDPLYLANKAREIGALTRFIDLADQINQEMPKYFIRRAGEKIGGLKGKKVLVIGVSYKPNVADVRETPVESLILGLEKEGAEVYWHDELVKEWNNEKSVALSNKFDLAILATPHDYLNLTKLGDVPILNTRGSI
jgi:UDP-N-acetyl-D-glucosamine dehydrogenase